MPQIIPYYFVNQATFAFLGLFIIIFIISKYILPAFLEVFVSRIYITKLLYNIK